MLYKLILDFDAIDMNKLLKKAADLNLEVCFSDDFLYFHGGVNTQRSITSIMKEMNTENYFLKEITDKPEVYNGNLAQSWCREKLEEDEMRQYEIEHQDQLQRICKNIEDIKAMLQQSKKGGEVDGGGNKKETR